MKLHSSLLIIFSLFLFLIATTKSQEFGSCGAQAGGALCAPGFCCSTFGFCGNTSAYCDPGNCQSQCPLPQPPPIPQPPPLVPGPPPAEPIYCGINHANATCPDTMCCLVTGICANSNSFWCSSSEWCESQCPFTPPPPPPPQNPILCGALHGGATCPSTMCCTVFGFCEYSASQWCSREWCQSQCGNGAPICGVNGGGGICGRAHCCTKDGSCEFYNSAVCLAPFCQDHCRNVPVQPAGIAMLKAIR